MLNSAIEIWASSCLIIVLIWGSREQRITVVTLFVGSHTTALIFWNTGRDWLAPSPWLAVNELVISAIILWIAFRSERFWPLPIAAFQLIVLAAHFVTYFTDAAQSYALGVLQGIWYDPQMIILLIATWRHVKREKAAKQT